jgi:hypothetical protein
MTKNDERVAAVHTALGNLGLDLPSLNFIEKDALSNVEGTRFHITDRTPILVPDDSPSHGGGGPREFCFSGQAMDIGGKAVTGSDGKMRWILTNYICEDALRVIDEPVAFVATPRATGPVLMTSNTVSTGNDLVIDVFSWNTDGTPAASTRFSWRCWFNFPQIIL